MKTANSIGIIIAELTTENAELGTVYSVLQSLVEQKRVHSRLFSTSFSVTTVHLVPTLSSLVAQVAAKFFLLVKSYLIRQVVISGSQASDLHFVGSATSASVQTLHSSGVGPQLAKANRAARQNRAIVVLIEAIFLDEQ